MTAHPGETQIEFELRVLHGHRLGAILTPPDPTQPRLKHPTAEELASYPASVDLRQHDPPIMNQGSLGSCVAHAWAATFEWLENYAESSVYFAGSRLALYKWSRDHDGTTGDVGTTPPSMDWVVTNKGVPHESLWPYDISQFDVEPPSSVTTDAAKAKSTASVAISTNMGQDTAIADIKKALNTPLVVPFTFEVYSNYDSVESNGLIPMPGGTDVGGHANVVVGYNDATTNLDGSKGAFIVRNSWGTSWGDKGYGYMPYAFCTSNLMPGAWVISGESEISVTPTPTPTPSGSAPNVNLNASVRTYQANKD